MRNLNYIYHLAVILSSTVICWLAWPTISSFTMKEIQPIASAVSTVSGVLVGFVMASISLFASASNNKLVKNTMLTGHLPKLVNLLHITMGLLLLVCLLFLIVLFLPDTLVFEVGSSKNSYRYSSSLLLIGIFFLIYSFALFGLSWKGFKDFAKHM